MADPSLIEPGARYFFRETLKQCRNVKDARLSVIFNVFAFTGLCALVAVFLWYKRRNKLTPKEVKENELNKQKYLVDKLKIVEAVERRDDMITNLPKY